jgi:hypothetical protein
MELVTLFRFVEVLVDAPFGATLTFSTDLPGNVMTQRASVAIPATAVRHPFRLSLPGSCKGKLYQVKLVPATWFPMRIYAAKVYARVLGPAASGWAWYTVPLPQTSSEWQPIELPIPQTPEAWQPVQLPIPRTAEEFQLVQLPIPQTPEAWQPVQFPIQQTPEEWQRVQFPIPRTADDWQAMQMPVKPTPVVPDWVQVMVDE